MALYALITLLRISPIARDSNISRLGHSLLLKIKDIDLFCGFLHLLDIQIPLIV
ncbi:Hypothetical protein BN2458_PEG1318 [Helicobacter typhlonius]|uniref:Uncharacterized protein n=1 Tax=Helicobacter typhlonius TaxID=76936 RepID=A0A0S4PVA4_9HELI|nr:Hypothetical protein BN2458_PEG1318 [Helicobacter typhlonius]